jgi:hypothetical protein
MSITGKAHTHRVGLLPLFFFLSSQTKIVAQTTHRLLLHRSGRIPSRRTPPHTTQHLIPTLTTPLGIYPSPDDPHNPVHLTTRTSRIILYPANPSGGRATVTVLHARRRWLWQQLRACTARARDQAQVSCRTQVAKANKDSAYSGLEAPTSPRGPRSAGTESCGNV